MITGSSAVGHDRRFKIFRPHARGQALVEFAIVVPIMLAVLGGIIQFGVIFWSQNTLTQIVRDTGRWEASQQTKPCDDPAAATAVLKRADSIASSASLIGYTPGKWTAVTAYPTSPRPAEGVEVAWPNPDPVNLFNTDCPPTGNPTAWFVTIRISHVIPVFIPGMQYLPGIGDQACTCLSISATTTFRMEPAPPP
jgi:TadE-like protein